ncbi:MAG: NAD(P)-dependent oxidoreductase [Proteobacteria bacterium]|nr:NAD(P)-dependent oxidoreductase [Pseudomonadota bacterium]
MGQEKKILVTGGAGSVGSDWTLYLLDKGYEVRVLDVNVEPLRSIENERLVLIQSGVEDRDAVRSGMEGVDAVLHLAWTFSGDPLETVQKDLTGHIYVMEEAVSQKVKHLIYTSTAVVYGKLQYSPIDEKHPLVVEEARKPLYGIAKQFTEKMCLMYMKEKGLPVTIIRFWWAYGREIGGRHLREMLRTAASGNVLEVPVGSGGSFVSMDDMSEALGLCLLNPKSYGETFNIATVYVTWEEVAEMVREVTGRKCEIRRVPREEWKGSAFLADPWQLDDSHARKVLGYSPTAASRAKSDLQAIIARRWEQMQSSEQGA